MPFPSSARLVRALLDEFYRAALPDLFEVTYREDGLDFYLVEIETQTTLGLDGRAEGVLDVGTRHLSFIQMERTNQGLDITVARFLPGVLVHVCQVLLLPHREVGERLRVVLAVAVYLAAPSMDRLRALRRRFKAEGFRPSKFRVRPPDYAEWWRRDQASLRRGAAASRA